MTETAITVQNIIGPFSAVAAGAADFTWTACDAVAGNSFQCTGREILLLRNDNVGAQTVVISSVDDEFGRSEDITDYSLAAGDYGVFGIGLTNAKGWKQTSGKILFTASHAEVFCAVLRLPA